MSTSADFIEGFNISVGHLGIVAGAFDTLGIAEVIDRAVPKTRHHHLTHSEVVKAQKWIVYHSAPMPEQQEKTFAKRLENDKKKAETSLRKLGAREFACEPDARIAAGKWLQEHPLFRFSSLAIRTTTRKMMKKRGRLKADESVEIVYTISAEIEYNPGAVAEKRQKLR